MIKKMGIYESYFEEKQSAYLYEAMVQHEQNALHKKLFADLRDAALKQAEIWKKKIFEMGLPAPKPFEPSLRSRIVAWLVKTLGSENTHFILSAMKIRGMSIFNRFHNEHKHITFASANNLRAAIFGINDGLISNMSLILGLAGAHTGHHFIVLAGIAGLLAGACSMGAGEYISVRSQREVFEYQIAIEKKELEEYPEEEAEELSLIYQARGLSEQDANNLAKMMVENPEAGLNALAREELGLNPGDLVSPVGAMLSSFFSFALGAIIPLLPFLFTDSIWNLQASMLISAFALFFVGTLMSLFTNRHPIILGLRMLGIGAIAGTLTYYIGKLLGSIIPN